MCVFVCVSCVVGVGGRDALQTYSMPAVAAECVCVCVTGGVHVCGAWGWGG